MNKLLKSRWFWFILLIVVVFVIPLIIHLSYHQEIVIFVTDWDATDVLLFYGSFLTFVGTISLGTLTLYQNQQFKVENDKIQQRLERINQEANEVNILNKIIEVENRRIVEITNKLNIFEKKLLPTNTLDEIYSMVEIHTNCINVKEPEETIVCLNGEILEWIDKYDTLLTDFELEIQALLKQDELSDKKLKFEMSSRLFKSIDNCIAITDFYRKICNNENEFEYFDLENTDCMAQFVDYASYKKQYLKERNINLNKLIYGKLTVAQIMETYSINSKEDTNESKRSES